MLTLTPIDFFVVAVLDLVITAGTVYIVNLAKRSAELSAEERSNDKEYQKKILRQAFIEARTELSGLRVYNFEVRTGNRRLTRMNTLSEVLGRADKELGDKF